MSIAIRSVLRSGGGVQTSGLPFTVNCDSFYAGKTIICTDGETELTATCPSSSPYDVQFNIPNSGTWTMSAQGSSISRSVTLPGSLILPGVPDGKTETPTDDITLWLLCAGLSISYSTLSDVLADTLTVDALMASDNAVDYLVRSTTWATDVCANQHAMQAIHENAYCQSTLLADSTWHSAICNSAYFETILNFKVPVMTSNSTPSGSVSASSEYSGNPAWHAFDNDSSTVASPATEVSTGWLQYTFDMPVAVNKVGVQRGPTGAGVNQFNVQMSNDGETWTELLQGQNANNASMHYFIAQNSDYYTQYRLNITSGWNKQWWEVAEIQFWGTSTYNNVLNKVTMNNNYWNCTKALFWIEDNTWHLNIAFNKKSDQLIHCSIDLSKWLDNESTYTGFIPQPASSNNMLMGYTFTNGVFTPNIDPARGAQYKPQNPSYEFYGTV